ncbi:SseB family protein [Paracoccus lutimaris]|uniref:Type III secretion system (T3SS) SseB-like protein n=1 Tax=Paracoccus lutimaris TaxID=1490030 RepID=A0A368Z8W1_9RHOB|nr:SseB family protein [Paracoccus lutimaris]RCW88831.1 type III secretion system (T3SS) SseB-like protein [Paracoccus lutimaris]
MTPLDELCQVPFHLADAPGRARALSRLADTELFAALVAEPATDTAELQSFDLPEGHFALACDSEERLAGFVGGPVAYLAIPGRVLAATLAGEGQGVLINPGHPSQMMLDAATLRWLTGALAARPSIARAESARRLSPPTPEAVRLLSEPLGQRLADMSGLVGRLTLVQAEWSDGRQGHALMLGGVVPTHEDAVAKAFAELLAFLPQLPGGVDIGFSEREMPAGALMLEPAPPPPEPQPPRRDPKAPPRLR